MNIAVIVAFYLSSTGRKVKTDNICSIGVEEQLWLGLSARMHVEAMDLCCKIADVRTVFTDHVVVE